MLAVVALVGCSPRAVAPARDVNSSPSVATPRVSSEPSGGGERFPTAVSADGRSFVDARQRLWFGRGDTAWSLVAQLDREAVDRYLDDRASRGFNLVLANLLEGRYADNAPDNIYHDPPFTGDLFRSTPNEAYWRHVDYIVEAARERGITLLLCPAYLGSPGANDGLADEVRHASPEQMAEYGRFLAARYGEAPNIMWLIGHDRVPDTALTSREGALADELQDDLVGVGASSDPVLGIPQWSPLGFHVDFETVYSYRETPVDDVTEGWVEQPTRPVVFLEGKYEQEHDIPLGGDTLRLQALGAIGGGAAGVFFGNNPMWHFESVTLYPFEGSWEDNLSSLGAQDMARTWHLVDSLPLERMRPDVDGRLVVSGAGSGSERVAARYSGTTAFIYLPSSRPITLDLSPLSGARDVGIRRVDPRSGAVTDLGVEPTSARLDIVAPGANAAGDSDWVYVVSPAMPARAAG